MATASPRMDVKEELKCPICMEYLTVPVSVDCGHIFCRDCITQYCETWEDLGEDLECPLCKARIMKGNFRSNWQLANVVDKIECLGKGNECVRHQEKLNLFCKEDQELVCVGCERSPEHQSHTFLLLEDAALKYGGQLCHHLDVLRKEQERILVYIVGTERESRDLLEQVKAEKTKTTALFNRLHQFLEEHKTLFLLQMEELEKEIATRREEHMARLMEELSSLKSLIQHMEEKCQQPADELLQDIGRTLQRSEKKAAFENPVAFPPELKCRIKGFRNVKPLLERVMKQLQAEMPKKMPLREQPLLAEESSLTEVSEFTDKLKINKSKSPDGNKPKVLKEEEEAAHLPTKAHNLSPIKAIFKKGKKRDPGNDNQVSLTSVPASAANVTLDPNTAHPQLILSEDRKSVRWGDECQVLPNSPDRFDKFPAVLGCEGFAAGRHFWAVTVGSEGGWAVGVARQSVRRKDWFGFSPEEGIWAVGKWGGQYIVHNPPDNTPLSLSQELKKIRVTLYCAEGKVAFSNPDTGAHLYTYSGASFSRETLLPFFHVFGGAHLKLSP